MRKLVFLLLIVLLPTLVVAQEETTLTVWYLSQSPDEIAIVQSLADQFAAEHPGVTVDFSAYGYSDMNQTLSLALDSGTGPDVAYASPGPQDADLYIEAGYVTDLTAEAEARGWTERFASDVISYHNPTEDIHVLPYDLVTVGVFYNKAIFEELGLQPPQTFAEFEAILQTVRDAGIAPIAVGALDQWPLSHVWEQLVHVTAPMDVITPLEEGSPDASYDNEYYLQATAKLQEWADAGYFQDNALATNYNDANSLFVNELAAMTITGTWNNSTFASQPEFEAGFFAMPRLNEDIDWHMGGYTPNNVWLVPVHSQQQELALEFVDFVLGETVADTRWHAGDIVAYQFDELPDPAFPVQADVYAAMQQAGTGYYLGQLDGELQSVIWSALQELIAGAITPETVLERAEARYAVVVAGE